MGYRILVVDDAPGMRCLLGEMLAGLGHEVVGEAGSGREGLEAYVRLKPDVMMLDISLPDTTGLEVLEELRLLQPDAAAVLVSANDQDRIKEFAKKMNAPLVVKPFCSETLIQALEKIKERKVPAARGLDFVLTKEEHALVSHLVQTGSHASSKRLSDLTQTRWRVVFSGMEELPAERVINFSRHDPSPHFGVWLKSIESLPLVEYILLFPQWSVAPLVEAVGQALYCNSSSSNRDSDVIGEMANILGHGMLKAFADQFGQSILLGVPKVAAGSKTELLEAFLDEQARERTMCLTQVEMYSDNLAAISTCHLMLNYDILRGLMQRPRPPR